MEGSVIVERQDANSLAYRSDVTAKQLLSGSVEPPEWTSTLIKTLETCTGMPGNRQWIHDGNDGFRSDYAFGGMSSPGNEEGPSSRSGKKKRSASAPFPPQAWGRKKESGSYFDSDYPEDPATSTSATKSWEGSRSTDPFSTTKFDTHFESDFTPDQQQTQHHPRLSFSNAYDSQHHDALGRSSPVNTLPPYEFNSTTVVTQPTTHSRSMSMASPFSHTRSSSTNPFAHINGDIKSNSHQRSLSLAQPPYITPKPELIAPLSPDQGVARAIALYNFQAVEVCQMLLLVICGDNNVVSPLVW